VLNGAHRFCGARFFLLSWQAILQYGRWGKVFSH
jgi:hypothetical protein